MYIFLWIKWQINQFHPQWDRALKWKQLRSAWFPQNPPKEPESEPVKQLYDRYKAHSEAKATDASQAWDEVQPGHPSRSLKLWRIGKESVNYKLKQHFLTKDSWTSEENVHHSYVLLVGIVVSLPLYIGSFMRKKSILDQNLGERNQQLFLLVTGVL